MFDPTEFIVGGKYGHIVRYCRTDYMQGSPLIERLNPLRYEIGIGKRPSRFVWNRQGKLAIKWTNFNWWLWKRRYRDIFGYPERRK